MIPSYGSKRNMVESVSLLERVDKCCEQHDDCKSDAKEWILKNHTPNGFSKQKDAFAKWSSFNVPTYEAPIDD